MKKKKIKQEAIRFSPEIDVGLTAEQVEHRNFNNEKNIINDTTGKSYFKIIIDNVFTFFNILMISIAALFIIFLQLNAITNLSFLLVVFANILIGTIQECKSKKTIEKLKLLNTAKYTTIRYRQKVDVYPQDILLDDIITLKLGEQIPVDCEIRDGLVEVNESLLTGESRAIKKHTGDKLFAGSYIISGNCVAQAIKVGSDTYIHSIESKAKDFKKPKSKLMVSIQGIIKKLTSIVVPVGLLTFWNILITEYSTTNFSNAFNEAITKGGTSIIGMIPSGMILLASVAMATGVVKLANKKTLVQDLYSVESLARIDTLCLDKTGTLTDGTMTVDDTIEFDMKDIHSIMSSYMSAFEAKNQTSAALIKKYGNTAVYTVDHKIEFSSDRKYSAVEFKQEGAYALGAPEYLISDPDILSKCANYAKNGIRVVALIKLVGSLKEDSDELPKRRTIAALFMIRDNIRPEVKDTMKWFAENNVDIRVISGDNIDTVSYISKKCGIKYADEVYDMSTITGSDDFEKIVMSHHIYGRVSPEQKSKIVEVLKDNGKTVAVTGDGVNDILAMKKADCAVGLVNGSPATKNIANIVLMDSNFSCMIDAVMEGRRVVNNIQRSSTLFLMKDFFFLFLSLFCILIGINFPVETSVITLVNTFITGFGSVLLSIEPNSSRITGNFEKNVLGKSIPAGFFMFLPVMFIIIFSFFNAGISPSCVNDYISANMIPTISLCVTSAGFIVFYHVCKPFTNYRRILYIFIICLVALMLIAIPDCFLMNGTVFVKSILDISKDANGDLNIALAIQNLIDKFFNFSFYKSFDIKNWIIIGSFIGSGFLIYKLIDKYISKLLNITMFNNDKYKK